MFEVVSTELAVSYELNKKREGKKENRPCIFWSAIRLNFFFFNYFYDNVYRSIKVVSVRVTYVRLEFTSGSKETHSNDATRDTIGKG